MTPTIEQYKEALRVVSAFEKSLERSPKHNFSKVTAKTTLGDSGISTRLFNSLGHYMEYNRIASEYQFVINFKVSTLSQVSLKEFSKELGVGSTQIRELKELCRAAGVKMKV